MDVQTLEALYMQAINAFDTRRAHVLKRELDDAKAYEAYKAQKAAMEELDAKYSERYQQEQQEPEEDELTKLVNERLDKMLEEMGHHE